MRVLAFLVGILIAVMLAGLPALGDSTTRNLTTNATCGPSDYLYLDQYDVSSGAVDRKIPCTNLTSLYSAKAYSASGSNQSTTGTISSSSASLALSAAQDFRNGQGILVNHAGATFPAQVTPTGTTNGTTSVTSVSSCTGVVVGASITDSNSDIPPGDIVASCSGGTITLAQPSWSTLSAAATGSHVGGTLYIGIGDPSGASATAHGTDNSVTYAYQIASVDANGGVKTAITAFSTTHGATTLSSTNYIALAWTTPAHGAYYGVCIWRNRASAGYTLIGSVAGSPAAGVGAAASYNDIGGTANAAPYCPSTPPASDQADQLVTTISSGGGTTSLTLGASASTTATSQTVAHDDSAAILATLTAAEIATAGSPINALYGTSTAAVYLPAGVYNVCAPLPVTAPINIIGDGLENTALMIRPGCAAPTIPIQCSNGGTVYPDGVPCMEAVRRLRITAPSRVDGPGQANPYASNFNKWDIYGAHAIVGVNNASNSPGHINLNVSQVLIDGIPGDCMLNYQWQGVGGNSVGFTYGDGTNICLYPGAYGIMGEASADWFVGFKDVGGALKDNYFFSGSVQIHISGSIEVASLNNIHIYGPTASQIFIEDAYIDIAGQNGLYVASTGNNIQISNVRFRFNGTSANTTYSDIYLESDTTGAGVFLSNVFFEKAGSSCGTIDSSGNCPQYNINFVSGSALSAYLDSSVAFDLGTWATTNVTNNAALIAASITTKGASTTGAGTQTFTNSPCGTLTTERWLPVTVPGQTGTWYVPACQ